MIPISIHKSTNFHWLFAFYIGVCMLQARAPANARTLIEISCVCVCVCALLVKAYMTIKKQIQRKSPFLHSIKYNKRQSQYVQEIIQLRQTNNEMETTYDEENEQTNKKRKEIQLQSRLQCDQSQKCILTRGIFII